MSPLRPRGLHWSTVGKLCRPAPARRGPAHVFLCIADHYEPKWLGADAVKQRERVDRWVRDYPRMAEGLHDCLGRPPQHTFFYPSEEYEAEHLDKLAELCRGGTPAGDGGPLGDVEVHLHHDGDTSRGVRETLLRFTECLHERHGLLRRKADGRISYGFIHGNWALDNSRPDGRWCGVDDELTVLRETGCYADFTLPAAPDPCQTRTVNSIYYAADDATRGKSHDVGVAAEIGRQPAPESLLLIQGPLALDWGKRKWGLLPRLENADLTGHRPPTPQRLDLWLRAGVCVVGRPDWVFIKLHTHGAQEKNAAMLLGEPMRAFHQELAARHRRDPGFRYYYVTARQMADLVHQAEAGAEEPAIDDLPAALAPRTLRTK